MNGDDQAAPRGADWGKPLVRVDAAWQRLEARVCGAVLVAEIAVIALWVLLRGLASDYFPGQNAAGLITRALLTMALFGVGAHLATRTRGITVHRIAVSVAMFLGLLAGRLWAHAGVIWSSNLLNWLQNASVFMLVGGLRGLATRLTFWVSFLGASLATSRGKHIHVDVLLRYVPAKLRLPTAIVGWLGAATVCTVAVCGFVDYIAIAAYHADANQPCADDATKVCDAPASAKLALVAHETSSDLFILGRQLSLDIRSLPHVLAGTPYDGWMTAAQWNEWIDGTDWSGHFDPAQVSAQKMDASVPGATHMPAVEVPGAGGESRGLLIRELDFIFPFGLGVIAIKFLLRILIMLSGQIQVDVDAEENEDALVRATARDEAAAAAAKGMTS
ncbi:MAG TPA: TRAP transporter small permease subunit [Polyangiaceae bacterium]|nr:TRAP transporter small permease subunit [Polyangiaceae bacterium]